MAPRGAKLHEGDHGAMQHDAKCNAFMSRAVAKVTWGHIEFHFQWNRPARKPVVFIASCNCELLSDKCKQINNPGPHELWQRVLSSDAVRQCFDSKAGCKPVVLIQYLLWTTGVSSLGKREYQPFSMIPHAWTQQRSLSNLLWPKFSQYQLCICMYLLLSLSDSKAKLLFKLRICCKVARVLKEAIEDGKSKADLEVHRLLQTHSTAGILVSLSRRQPCRFEDVLRWQRSGSSKLNRHIQYTHWRFFIGSVIHCWFLGVQRVVSNRSNPPQYPEPQNWPQLKVMVESRHQDGLQW